MLELQKRQKKFWTDLKTNHCTCLNFSEIFGVWFVWSYGRILLKLTSISSAFGFDTNK